MKIKPRSPRKQVKDEVRRILDAPEAREIVRHLSDSKIDMAGSRYLMVRKKR